TRTGSCTAAPSVTIACSARSRGSPPRGPVAPVVRSTWRCTNSAGSAARLRASRHASLPPLRTNLSGSSPFGRSTTTTSSPAPRLFQGEQEAALPVDRRLRRVEVLGLVVICERARAEADHGAARRHERHHEPVAKAVVESAPRGPSLVAASGSREPRLHQDLA